MSDTYTVRYTGTGRWRNRDGYRASEDDPLIEDVPESYARKLSERDKFHIAAEVDQSSATESDVAVTAPDFEPDAEDGELPDDCVPDEDLAAMSDDETADSDVSDGWADWNEDDWYELDYGDRVDAVHEGRVDDHLDTIYETETSEKVKDAVGARRETIDSDIDADEPTA